MPHSDFDSLSPKERSIAQQRFSMIASAVAVVDDEKKRNEMIRHSAEMFGVSKTTVRKYLCAYLVSQDISVLVHRQKKEKELLRSGVGQQIKVDYRQKGNTMPKAYAQQQIICALVKDNSLYNSVSKQLTADNFTDGDMKRAYIAFSNLI